MFYACAVWKRNENFSVWFLHGWRITEQRCIRSSTYELCRLLLLSSSVKMINLNLFWEDLLATQSSKSMVCRKKILRYSMQAGIFLLWSWNSYAFSLLSSSLFIFSLYFLSSYSFSSFSSSSLGFCFPSIIISVPLLLNIDGGEGQRKQAFYSVVENIVSHVNFMCSASCCSDNWSSFLNFKSWNPSILTPSFHPL